MPDSNFYCTACGEESEAVLPDILLPGEFEVKCKLCKTRFIIDIGFHPQEEKEEE